MDKINNALPAKLQVMYYIYYLKIRILYFEHHYFWGN